jgi:predicted AlkP superfamily pyrophosphatase or phosphodiesterase
MRKAFILSVLALFNLSSWGQEQPKLVVGIVVDQMRYDYVYRFWDEFEEDGLKKLVQEGHFFRNTNFGYVPTYTGPGHASIFTGTTPAVHGIIANNWYDKAQGKSVYCAGDGSTHTVCQCEEHKDVGSDDGQMSPHRMMTTTIGDELQLFNPASKVMGISLKDRGAILPAGHMGDAAYWMNGDGEWITSSYYMEKLPEWLIKHQNTNSAYTYLKDGWKGDGFDYNLDSLFDSRGGGIIKSTPHGNTILKDLAKAMIKNEKLGKDEHPDFLSISFSSTDYVGHQHGPHAEELIDTYMRLDKDLADLMRFLEDKVGKENLLVFLTADHGVVSVPNELKKLGIPAGYFAVHKIQESLNKALAKEFGVEELIEIYDNQQFFLDQDLMREHQLNSRSVQEFAADYLLRYEGIKNTFTAYQMHHNEYQDRFHSLIQRGFNQKRSGDILIALHSGWIEWGSPTGTTHGSHYSYDTHVPLIFWGKGVQAGVSDEKVYIRDIAPTICTQLGISFPTGCTGNPIRRITE